MLKSLAVNLYKCFFYYLQVGTLLVLVTCDHLLLFASLDVSEDTSLPPSKMERVPLLAKLIRFDEDVPVPNRLMYNSAYAITSCIVTDLTNLQYQSY